MHAVYRVKNCTLRSLKHQLYGDIKSRYEAGMELFSLDFDIL